MKDIPFFPITEDLNNKEQIDSFWKSVYTSVPQDALHYWILLHSKLQSISLEPVFLDDLSLTIIGQYRTAPEAHVHDPMEVMVAYERYPYEMNASDWLIKKLTMSGETILNKRTIYNLDSGKYLDALCYKKFPSGDEVISRFWVLKQYDKTEGGGIYLMVKASCLKSNYAKNAYHLLHIIANWGLTNKSASTRTEKLKIVKTNNAEPCQFYLPESWEVQRGNKSEANISHYVLLHNLNKTNAGAINITACSSSLFNTADQVLHSSFDRFDLVNDLTHSLNPLQQTEESLIYNPSIDELYETSGFIIADNIKLSVDIRIVKTKVAWYYIETVGPQANDQDHFWEVNQRCLELIVDTLNNVDAKKRAEFEMLNIEEIETLDNPIGH